MWSSGSCTWHVTNVSYSQHPHAVDEATGSDLPAEPGAEAGFESSPQET